MFEPSSTEKVDIATGVTLWPSWFDASAQSELIADVFTRAAEAPFYRPRMPRSGKPFSVEETNFGSLGWFSDEAGYRYIQHHPLTDRPWPGIPGSLLRAWDALTDFPAPPECCLVNLYLAGARMGLHQDRDEAELGAPVLSVSLGDDAIFRIGGNTRRSQSRSVAPKSGDVLVFGGAARLVFHGIDRVIARMSALLPGGGRVNLTLRRVTRVTKNKTPDQGADRASHAPLRADAGRG